MNKLVVGLIAGLQEPAPIKAFRGNVDLSKFDDRVDPENIVGTNTPCTHTKVIPTKKTNEEIDRQSRYNQIMGRTGVYGMGYVFT